MEKLKGTAIALFVFALIALPIWITVGIWSECRAEGHSFFYCAKLIGH